MTLVIMNKLAARSKTIVCCSECLYAECLYGECLYAECLYAECLYAECLYAECLCAECLYAEYEESIVVRIKSNLLLMIFWLHIFNYNS
jgi:hypothetical protein